MQKISDAEEIIMCLVWSSDHDPDLQELVQRSETEFGKIWKIQTVATYMKRIEGKKYVSVYRVGRYSHYRAEVKIDDYRKMKLEEVKKRLFRDDFKEMREFLNRMA